MDRRRFLCTVTPIAVAAPLGCTTAVQSRRLREFHLSAVVGQALTDTGRPPVAAWTYGGSVPGPQLRVRQGDRVRVHVTNQLGVPTTVHWHGVRLPNAMDGVPHLTQPPIEPGERFVYEFDALDAGTYWYHSHFQSSEQLDRGLYGTLIVEERQPLPVHRDVTWVLDDWRITASGQISETFGNTHDMAHAGRIGNTVTVNGSVQDQFPVRAGERIRLRLVNAANARIFALRFQGHRPLVVAIDGQPVSPHGPDGGRIVVAPGMRCDVVIDAVGRAGERYEVQDVFYPREQFVLMDLVFGAAPRLADAVPPVTTLTGNPVPEPDLPSATTHEIVFGGGMMGNLHQAMLDGKPIDMRGLLRRGKAWAINGHVSDSHHMDPMLRLRIGRTYVFRMKNDTAWHHPIHLHGHAFRVLRRSGRPTPHREWQDTVLMSPREEVEVAFVADNPGSWMFHCHILEHQEGGMMSVVEVV
ncbi:MAG: multicopper oxidase family protein [Desulfobacterales bacterium]|nr:multicopper oxidase family protein [Desulfobacterales bacterium]